ncbi:MAG TPA: FAD binding domain-containing protein, partial [Kouleothrix sp.]|nr:FAD binding domain-containing protein [Kouleothrix sp.]
MIPSEFQYFAPATVDEAVGLLQQHGDDAKLIAGGHSLLPALKLRLSSPSVLIDVSKIGGLDTITVNGSVTIGAGATYRAIASSDAVRGACGVLAECVAQIGDNQVRNRGTIGGSLAHADPAAELPAVVLALDAIVHVASRRGRRALGADEFFSSYLETVLAPDEVLVGVDVPVAPA